MRAASAAAEVEEALDTGQSAVVAPICRQEEGTGGSAGGRAATLNLRFDKEAIFLGPGRRRPV